MSMNLSYCRCYIHPDLDARCPLRQGRAGSCPQKRCPGSPLLRRYETGILLRKEAFRNDDVERHGGGDGCDEYEEREWLVLEHDGQRPPVYIQHAIEASLEESDNSTVAGAVFAVLL